MPFNIIRADITKVKADAIVNTANPQVAVGAGVDQAIYEAAGAKALLAERAKIGPMKPGQAAATPAFALDAKYIIHTVGPAWRGGGYGECEAVASCYRESLKLADELGCESVAFPLISTGTYGFPKDEALRIAISEISAFLFGHEMDVTMVVYGKEAFVISSKAFANIQTFIEDKDVKEPLRGASGRHERRRLLNSFREWRREKQIRDLEEELGRFPSEESIDNTMQFDEELGLDYDETSQLDYDLESLRDIEEGRWLDEEEELRSAPFVAPRAASVDEEEMASYSMSEGALEEAMPDEPEPYPSYSMSDAGMPDEPITGAGAPSQQMELEERKQLEKLLRHEHQMRLEKQIQLEEQKQLEKQMPLEKKGRPGFAPSIGVRKDKRDENLKDVLGRKGESFQHMLFRIIDRKGLTDPEVYKRANLDRKHFSKIRSNENYTPKKKTALALAVALELNMDETVDLLRRAGLALSPNSEFDLIVGYCIEHRIYNIMDINTYLFKYDQELLGA